MKLYDGGRSPNPRRVRIFLAEKGIPCPELIPIDLARLEHRSADYAALNPVQRIPALELDNGVVIAESVAICRYFEELHPAPPLFGRDAEDKAIVEMWSRRLELGLLADIASTFRHSHPFMAPMEQPQVPEWAAVCRAKVPAHLKLLDDQLARHRFVTGDAYTIADITAMVAIDFMRLPKIPMPEELIHVKRWHAEVSSRPSAAA
jgi:glutathione S-transferase